MLERRLRRSDEGEAVLRFGWTVKGWRKEEEVRKLRSDRREVFEDGILTTW
jgi:hypothetical protein